MISATLAHSIDKNSAKNANDDKDRNGKSNSTDNNTGDDNSPSSRANSTSNDNSAGKGKNISNVF